MKFNAEDFWGTRYPEGYKETARVYGGKVYPAFNDEERINQGWKTTIFENKPNMMDWHRKLSIKIPKGSFYIIETDNWWYFKKGKYWYSIERTQGTPPFEY